MRRRRALLPGLNRRQQLGRGQHQPIAAAAAAAAPPPPPRFGALPHFRPKAWKWDPPVRRAPQFPLALLRGCPVRCPRSRLGRRSCLPPRWQPRAVPARDQHAVRLLPQPGQAAPATAPTLAPALARARAPAPGPAPVSGRGTHGEPLPMPHRRPLRRPASSAECERAPRGRAWGTPPGGRTIRRRAPQMRRAARGRDLSG
mmetsp:Transcript_4104/g.17213  ORF Transcript_4104/g.17213 Transcript_4104/m.17213 type:complete len:201 (+) Transcript_4104:2168-2770(+)